MNDIKCNKRRFEGLIGCLKEGWYRVNDAGYAERVNGVTHFMKIPEPPKDA